jgi:hypothetical protein
MKQMPKIADLEKMIVAKIRDKVSNYQGRLTEDAMKKKARRIGTLLTAQTKKNIRTERLIDTGRLLNSIASKTATTPKGFIIQYGSYGVNYAAAHEYGFRGQVSVPAHTRRSKKGTVYNVRSYTKFMRIRERAFIRPAYVMQRDRIKKIVMGEV